MGKPKPAYQPKETRVNNLREVSLGYPKKITQDEARRCPQCAQATCMPACPLGIDIPGFIRSLRDGDAVSALERIRQNNPFPEICGRICPAPCEQGCVFHADGEPISIRELERYAADMGTVKEKSTSAPAGAKKVAIIGAGLSGLSAAYHLAKANLGVTVFEATHEAGGALRFGIPEFRLPSQVLEAVIARLKSLGVEIQTDVVLGRNLTVDEISMRGFSATLLATGASLPVFSDLPGSQFGHVYYDVEFLGEYQNINKEGALQHEGKKRPFAARTVVLGKGNAAFDAARLSLRLGSQVDLVFAGLEEQLDVRAETLEESLQEGLRIHSMQVLEIVGDDNGSVCGVKCLPLHMVEGDKGISLEVSKQEPVVLETQCVIIANGHRYPDTQPYLPQLKLKKDGSWLINEDTGMTSMEKVFACAHTQSVDWSVVDAIASGKKAAQRIIGYLNEKR